MKIAMQFAVLFLAGTILSGESWAAIYSYTSTETIQREGGVANYSNITSDSRNIERIRSSNWWAAVNGTEQNDATIDSQNNLTNFSSPNPPIGIAGFDVYDQNDFGFKHQLSWGAPNLTNAAVTITGATLEIIAYGVSPLDANGDPATDRVGVYKVSFGSNSFALGGTDNTTSTTTVVLNSGAIATIKASYTEGVSIRIDKNPNDTNEDLIRILSSKLTLNYNVDTGNPAASDIVPEPASLAIWGLGMSALGFVGFVRRKK